MSLNYAVLGLLSEQPMSGFDLIREFDVARSVIWPAPQNEVYRVLARLAAERLIAAKETGPRGRKTYAITRAGRAALAQWLAAPSDYTLRYDPILKAGFLGSLPARARAARAEADLAFYAEQLKILRNADRARKASNETDPRADVRKMAIGLYAALAECCRDMIKDAEAEIA
ncbi:MAG: PadR family transcriptional regulator [Alphaproteobacteria bacterium]